MSLESDVERETIRQPYNISRSNLPRMLDIRATVRQSVALPYSFLEMVQYDPSVGLLLTFAVCEVRIEGRCLDELYNGLVQHTVEYIQENDAKYENTVAEKKPFISRVEIKPISDELELMVKGFNPEREPLAED
ncbi:MAG TPA: hypothetical protein VGH42_14305 [Verrucomicrobiae bacterium]|jgi:hypothetical protein